MRRCRYGRLSEITCGDHAGGMLSMKLIFPQSSQLADSANPLVVAVAPVDPKALGKALRAKQKKM